MSLALLDGFVDTMVPLAGFGAARSLTPRIRTHLLPGRHLDVGCGMHSWLWKAGVEPFGIDISRARTAVFSRRGRSADASATRLPFEDGAFDAVWCFGLLHHLDDRDASEAIDEMVRVTRPGGRTVVFDGVPPRRALKRPLAAIVRRLDRGRHMRPASSLLELFDDSWSVERFTYSYTGLEGVFCVRENGESAAESR